MKLTDSVLRIFKRAASGLAGPQAASCNGSCPTAARSDPPPSPMASKKLNERMGALQWVLQDYSFETMPQWISFATTCRCNLRCPHCQTHGTEALASAFDQEVWPGELADRLSDELLPLAHAFCLSLNGEPLMTPHLITRLRRWCRHGARLHLTTNGMLLSEKILEAVIPIAAHIGVSVDAATPRVYEGIRSGGLFPKLVTNLRLLTATLERLDDIPKPELELSVTLMGSNLKELRWLVELADFVGARVIRCYKLEIYFPEVQGEALAHHKALYNRCSQSAVRRAQSLGIRLVGLPPLFTDLEPDVAPEPAPASMIVGVLPDSYYASLPPLESYVDQGRLELQAARIASRVRENAHGSGRDVAGAADTEAPKERLADAPDADHLCQGLAATTASWASAPDPGQVQERLQLEQDRPRGYCETLQKASFIDFRGDVTPCCVTPARPVLGNIHSQDFRSIWNGDAYRELKRRIWSLDPPDFCKGCSNLLQMPQGELAGRLALESPPPGDSAHHR